MRTLIALAMLALLAYFAEMTVYTDPNAFYEDGTPGNPVFATGPTVNQVYSQVGGRMMKNPD